MPKKTENCHPLTQVGLQLQMKFLTQLSVTSNFSLMMNKSHIMVEAIMPLKMNFNSKEKTQSTNNISNIKIFQQIKLHLKFKWPVLRSKLISLKFMEQSSIIQNKLLNFQDIILTNLERKIKICLSKLNSTAMINKDAECFKRNQMKTKSLNSKVL